MTHHCHAQRCILEVPESMFMCASHWRQLTPRLRSSIWANYIAGQEITKTPSPGYLKAAHEAITWLAREEGWIDEDETISTMEQESLF